MDNPRVKGARMTLAKLCLSFSLLIPDSRKVVISNCFIEFFFIRILPSILRSVSLILEYNSFTRGLSIFFLNFVDFGIEEIFLKSEFSF